LPEGVLILAEFIARFDVSKNSDKD
jgi:hypothetical protein